MSYVNEFPHGRMWDSDLRQILEMYNTVKGLPNDWVAFKHQFNNEWDNLKSFVNTYFVNLDVQEEINNKIDVLVANGTIESMLRDEFNAYTTIINAQMDLLKARMDTFTTLPENATTGDAELADAHIDYSGQDWGNVGNHIRGMTTNLRSEIDEIRQNYDLVGVGKNKFDGKVRIGGYDITTGEYVPENQTAKCNINPVAVTPLAKYYLSNNGSAINAIIIQYDIDGNVLVWANATTFNAYANCAYINFYGAAVSELTMVSSESDLSYEPYRNIYQHKTLPTDEVLEYTLNYVSQNLDKPKENVKILNMGDSLWGNFEGKKSLSGIIASVTGATTYNCGFGGCRMTKRTDNQYWDAFGMHSLADAISSGDWTLQDTAVANMPSGMPSYFAQHLETLKNLDFSTIDYLTIGYGVNDYMGGKYVENESDLKDINYVNGALRYSIEKILTTFPNIKIVVCGANFAVWFDSDGNIQYTSDEPYYNNSTDVTLPQINEGLKKVSNEYHVHFVDVYNNIGINKYNASTFFSNNDGVHPNEKGRDRQGKYIANELLIH